MTALATAFKTALAGAQGGVQTKVLEFHDLDGWATDDHQAALQAFQTSSMDLSGNTWQQISAKAHAAPQARTFFETYFRPVVIGCNISAFFTAYYEPELEGERHRTDLYRFPVYHLPSEAVGKWLSRQEIEESGVLQDRGLEIAWINDPVAVFFLQIQGSGRIRLTDGSVIRVGYAGRNGHEYRSIGQELVRRGVLKPDQVSAKSIQCWLRRNPEAGQDLLWQNPSYVFFREVDIPNPETGPVGSMNCNITPHRSIAVDPAFTPLGAPVWIEKDGAKPIRRLMVAQDTGSAIRGPQRADLFYGFGDDVADQAGAIRDPGRMVVLLPNETAKQITGGV